MDPADFGSYPGPDPIELIEENRDLLELVAESDTEAGKTAQRLLDHAESGI